jgi:hypothetical protein
VLSHEELALLLGGSISCKYDIGPGTEARWTTTKLILTA